MLFTSRSALAQERLLAELRTQGNCVECSPPEMTYSIAFIVQQPPHNHGGWSLTAGIDDVGHEFEVPSDLLPALNNVLTYNGFLDGIMACCSGDIGVITSAGLTDGTQNDKVMITRFVPPLGLNFFGYQITDFTMTIDRLEWIPISFNEFRAETAYTSRIYGIPEPTALGIALIGFALISLRIRLPRR
jgi:hypothetical protein